MLKLIKFTLLATIISGTLSGLSLVYGDNYLGIAGMFYATGILFGLTTAILFRNIFKLNIPRLIVWVVASTFSWRAAVFVFMSTGGSGLVSESESFLATATPQFILAGIAGSTLLALLFWAVIYRSSVKSMIITIATGAVLALVMNLIFKIGESPVFLCIAFTVWQSGVALSFATQKQTS